MPFTDDKSVILVLMYYTFRPKTIVPSRPSNCYPVIVQVNVLYHETVPGLLQCEENNAAASAIRKTLLEYSTVKIPDTSGHDALTHDVGGKVDEMSAACVKNDKNKGFSNEKSKKYRWSFWHNQ